MSKYDFLVDWFSYNKVYLDNFMKDNKNNIEHVLEIGSWEGMSAVYFLENLNLKSITLIDPCPENSYKMWIKSEQFETIKHNDLNQYNRLIRNLSATGQFDKCLIYRNTSFAILPQLKQKSYDFIFIDGVHLPEYVEFETKYAYKLLKDNGYILFDDYFISDELKNKIDELIVKYNFKIILKFRQVLVQKQIM
jgi:predicted O-methyltransferase YrrM